MVASMLLTGLFVFVAVCLVDTFWTRYIQTTAEGRALEAAIWSTLIIVGGSYTTVNIVKSQWYMIPATIGAFIGTYFIVKYHKRV